MKRKMISTAVFTAVSFLCLAIVLAASTVTYPHSLKSEVRFYGDFSPTPTARDELHKAEVHQWEYILIKSDKNIVENGSITSFRLIENQGENFKGLTGYSMIYLPNNPGERTSKIKKIASRYNGNPVFVSQMVEGYLKELSQGKLQKNIYKTFEYDKTTGQERTYYWISAGHVAYLSGATDSLDKYGNQCVNYIGKPCGSTDSIKSQAGEEPRKDHSGRAMNILTPFPIITNASLQQNGSATTMINSEQPFTFQASFTAYGGWGTGGYAYIDLNGTRIPLSSGPIPDQLVISQDQSIGKEGEFGYKFTFSRDMENYKQYLKKGKNTLTLTVSDSYQRYKNMTVEFMYDDNQLVCNQPVLLHMDDVKQPLYFMETSERSKMKMGGFLTWGIQFNSSLCTVIENINGNLGKQESIGTPIRINDKQTSLYLNNWQYQITKSDKGVYLENLSKDNKALVTYLIDSNGAKINRYVLSRGTKIDISLPQKKYKGEYSLLFPSPLVDNDFWKKSSEQKYGLVASWVYPEVLINPINTLLKHEGGGQ
ncbi:hypothetical protein ABHN05_13195 [Brevibacillus laterosporus]|uniref:Rrf2 family transcriptional regulator n=1 Tax=Brevibacillus laterosporus TaxID=1465 RepID=UPI00112663AD|nr:Rrf2 family transcriptional regulator [Brevibacillus laterosporus]MBG9790969.1 hypothetical protein [Brevibacillus laterosporus]MBG9804908.1 hypothetical protein [Brevibacillus laterosporus]MED1790555.1 hypothetical protein [Brevibacillus laterosporus]MED4762084.1 hypothetical protein [Brevibacillus laterosporus]TPH09945.1 hypothetical protein EGH09_21555 [Brevibacillus laterosporus]